MHLSLANRESSLMIISFAVAYPELVSGRVSKSRKFKGLVKVGASKGVIRVDLKKIMAGGIPGNQKIPLDTPLSMYDDIRLHVALSYVDIISRQSLLFYVILLLLYCVQPSSLRSSSLPSPLYFHYHRPPSYIVFLSSHHMPIPLQPSFLYYLCDFPHFHCPSYSFIYSKTPYLCK